ncbi:Vacuolar import and degradation protein 27 [Savitreella phatthalungensis]
MFAIKSLGRAIFGNDGRGSDGGGGDGEGSDKLELCSIPQGQLYLLRPSGIKGLSECIFKDAQASVRRTGQQYQYLLCIERAYEEGESDLEDDEGDEDGGGGSGDGLADAKVRASIEQSRRSLFASQHEHDDGGDIKTWLLDESVKFRRSEREGCAIFQWRDAGGEDGDSYTFVCDPATRPGDIATFEVACLQCMYERKHRRSYAEATEQDLESLRAVSPGASMPQTPAETSRTFKSLTTPAKKPQQQQQTPKTATASASRQPAAPSSEVPVVDSLAEAQAELHLFDGDSGVFELQSDAVHASVGEIGKWQYYLSVRDNTGELILGQLMEAEMNPVFNYEQLCFIWNYYDDEDNAYSWLLRFKDHAATEAFQEGVMRALWEKLNEQRWIKQSDEDREYLMAINEDVEMAESEDEREEDVEEYESEEEQDVPVPADAYDSSDDEEQRMSGEGENSQLAVGYKHDRSFVVRGDKIGVFRHTKDNGLEFATAINKIQTIKGARFQPSKVMLHNEDGNLVMQNPDDPSRLYNMDLEYGKVVDEWKVHDDVPVVSFAPSSKFAGMTGEQTLVGLSKNSLYKIDPRLSGNKLVDSMFKQYKSQNDFTAAATTEAGYIAVASNKGDIRLYDRLGINAKTALPPMSAPIIGVDVSADGRWVLATTKTYLLLIDAKISEGKNAGELGFKKSFGKDSKPRPHILQLSPEHVALMQGKLAFTPAKFNAGPDTKEKSIVTSTGPYVITWSLDRVIAGARASSAGIGSSAAATKPKYRIRKYEDEVKADNFRFGSDKNVIVALPNDVSMVDKKSFKPPTRQSLSTPIKQRLNRSSIVNSPF